MTLNKVLSSTLILAMATTVKAGSYDKDTSDLLIQKFQKVLLQLAPNDSAREGVQLRLADLMSERARFLSVSEIEQGCMVNCVAGEKDRNEAIKLYKAALKTMDANKSGRVLAQMGHLYQMMGEQANAEALYLDVLKKDVADEVKAEAEFSLAEMYFKQRNFLKALAKYNAVLGKSSFQRRGQATYRKAWAYYNLGQPDVAIKIAKEILNSPELLTKSSVAGVVAVDPQFQSEVARDLATFYSHFHAATNEAEDVYKYSPENAKLANVGYLANELQRLGQVKRSIATYEFLYQLQSKADDRLETLIHLSQMHLDQKNKQKSIELNTQALDLWAANGCQQDKCKELHSRLRKYVLDWHHQEKKAPSLELFAAYNRYIKVFSSEVDMILWASDIAQTQKNWTEAYSLVSSALVQWPNFESDKKPSQESLLLSLIEISEQSKDKALHLKSLQNYVNNSSEKSKIDEVNYQVAKWHYDAGEYQKASDLFYQLAVNATSKNTIIKKQAADLALDALVLLKDTVKIESWSQQFAQVFAGSKTEYLKIARTSQMNQIVSMASTNDASQNLQQAWDKLNSVSLDGASTDEQVTYYRNKILLGVKLQKLTEVKLAAQKLAQIKGVSSDDKELALSRMAWVSELQLDFKTAYNVTQKMILKELSQEEKSLKLALLADLSGQNSSQHYQTYLKHVPNTELAKKRAVVLKLIENSKKPLTVLQQNKSAFTGAEDLYAELLIKNTAKNKISGLLKDKMVQKSYVGQILWRQSFIAQVNSYAKKLAAHKIRTKSQNQLARDLKTRVKMLDKMEAYVAEAINKKDWMAQILTMHNVGKEQKRFYNEIIALPVPNGLSPEEQQQYLTLLSQQAAPHLAKASEFEAKESEFWANEKALTEYQDVLKTAKPELVAYYKNDLTVLAAIAPDAAKPGISSALSTENVDYSSPAISLADLESIRNKVRKEPFNGQFLNELKVAEEQLGNKPMTAYLEQRISKLNNQDNSTTKAKDGNE